MNTEQMRQRDSVNSQICHRKSQDKRRPIDTISSLRQPLRWGKGCDKYTGQVNGRLDEVVNI